jgi:hypothetical protein
MAECRFGSNGATETGSDPIWYGWPFAFFVQFLSFGSYATSSSSFIICMHGSAMQC